MEKGERLIIIFIALIAYLFTISSLFRYNVNFDYSFGFYEILLKSIFHFLFLFLLIYLLLYFSKKIGKIIKSILSLFVIIMIVNFWYSYNSFPTIQKVRIVNNKENNIQLIIKPIYLFDNTYNNFLNIDNEFEFILFGGGEYQLLKDKIIEIEGYYEGSKIYSKNINTYSITRGNEIEPTIIIE